ncbi:MAG: YciI family protein [Solirubrobacteraceae bacterium]
MPQYLLSVYQPPGTPPEPGALATIMRELDALNDELRAAGAWVFSAGLDGPATATVLRASGGDVVTTDGPFLESKEYLGGFTIVESADLDAALSWGEKLTRITGLPIEVRPFMEQR